MSEAMLELRSLGHSYGRRCVFEGLSLAVEKGQVTSILGASGCGKTTVLRLIAGLERVQRGEIWLAGRKVADAQFQQAPERRPVAMMFQDLALFPHLTVADNVFFGIPRARRRQAAVRAQAKALLTRVGLTDLATSYPHRLSGGERQRVALARALMAQPEILLLDEPFVGLDSRLRQQMRDDTLHLLKELESAALLVTHDWEEAMFMSDNIALLHGGGLVQVGTPGEIYSRPSNAFAASFFGETNALAAVIDAAGQVQTALGSFPAPNGVVPGMAQVFLRPEALRLHEVFASSKGERMEGERMEGARACVLAARFLGRSSFIHLALKEHSAGQPPVHLHASVPGAYLPRPGTELDVEIDSRRAFVFNRNDEK